MTEHVTIPQFSILQFCIPAVWLFVLDPIFCSLRYVTLHIRSTPIDHLLTTDVNAVAASASETVQSLAEKEIFTVPVSGNETLHVTLLLDLIKIIQLVCTKELFPMRMETSKNVLLDKCMLHHCLYYK